MSAAADPAFSTAPVLGSIFDSGRLVISPVEEIGVVATVGGADAIVDDGVPAGGTSVFALGALGMAGG